MCFNEGPSVSAHLIKEVGLSQEEWVVCWVLSLLSQVGGCRIPHRNSSRLGSSALGASSGPCPTRHGSERSENVIQEVKIVWQEATLSRGGGGGDGPSTHFALSLLPFLFLSLLITSSLVPVPVALYNSSAVPPPLSPPPSSQSQIPLLLFSSPSLECLRRYKEGREASPPPPALLIPPPLSLSLSP